MGVLAPVGRWVEVSPGFRKIGFYKSYDRPHPFNLCANSASPVPTHRHQRTKFLSQHHLDPILA
ncbi:MAG: hypothetical protein PHF66_06795, partial [Desulfobacteraceae bacterium]|nr:hypothetical protein [Desulfobacteraceae bacterium]